MTEIKLNYQSKDLREIYFGEGHQKYFFGPETKRQSWMLVIALALYPFFLVYSIQLEDNWLMILGTIYLGLVMYDFQRKTRPIIYWKKAVEAFLERVDNNPEHRLVFNEEHITFMQGDTETILHWSIIKRASIHAYYIGLTAEANLLFPKKSMTEKEFEGLKSIVERKVAQVHKN
jgi:hypothetical protein